MEQTLLNHLLQLAERTGDRIIVVDPVTRKPFVLMGLSQYESLLGTGDQDHDVASGALRGAESSTASMVPGSDPIAQRANAEFAAWRATQPAEGVAMEAPVVSMTTPFMPAGATSAFAPEPMHAAIADDDRFYVEPIE